MAPKTAEKGKVCVSRAEVPALLAKRGLLGGHSLAKEKGQGKLDSEIVGAVSAKKSMGEINRLLKAGAALDARDSSGNTLLSIAAWNGDEDIVNLLLEADSAGAYNNEDKVVAHYYASVQGELELAKKIRLNIENGN